MKIMLIVKILKDNKIYYQSKRFNNVKNFSSNSGNIVIETQSKYYTFKNVAQILIN